VAVGPKIRALARPTSKVTNAERLYHIEIFSFVFRCGALPCRIRFILRFIAGTSAGLLPQLMALSDE